jgi:hypothetical protein
MASAPDTVTEAIALLQADGYTEDFEQTGAQMTCPVCSTANSIDRGVVERIFRFEGPSDPGDEAIVLGVRCGNCGARGTVVSAFGPDADPEAFAHLVNLVAPPGAGQPPS